MDPFEDVLPIENGDFPASHVSLLEGTPIFQGGKKKRNFSQQVISSAARELTFDISRAWNLRDLGAPSRHAYKVGPYQLPSGKLTVTMEIYLSQ